MISKATDHISKLRVWPVYGDLGMLVQFIKSSALKRIWTGDKKIFSATIIWLFKAKIEMLALMSRSIFRYNHGRHTTGILMLLWVLTMVVAFNQGNALGHLLSFIPFGSILLFVKANWVDVQEMIWFQVTSQAITIWLVIFTITHIVHVARIYLEVGNTTDHMKRGSSWLHSGIFKTRYISEYKTQCFIEPILTALMGYGVWLVYDDKLFLVLAIASAISIFLQEFADGSYRYYHSRF